MRGVLLLFLLLGAHTRLLITVLASDSGTPSRSAQHARGADDGQSFTAPDTATASPQAVDVSGNSNPTQAGASSAGSDEAAACSGTLESESAADTDASTALIAPEEGDAAAAPAKAGKTKEKTKKGGSSSSRKQPLQWLLGKFQKKKPRTSSWDFRSCASLDRSAFVEQLRRAARDVQEAQIISGMFYASGRGTNAFFDGTEPVEQALADLMRSAPWRADEETYSSSSVDQSVSHASLKGDVIVLTSLVSGARRSVALNHEVSEEPLMYAVTMDNEAYMLRAFPVNMSPGNLQSTQITERTRAHSFKLFSLSNNSVSGIEMTEKFRWHLLSDAFYISPNKDTAVLPSGLRVVNYFILLKRMASTLRRFVRKACHLAHSTEEAVIMARTAVSLQILYLMSLFAQKGIHFTNLSVDSFELSLDGILYLTSLSPWYLMGRPYHVVDEGLGLYSVAKSKTKKGKGGAVALEVFDEGRNAADVVEIITTVWCGEEAVKSATAEACGSDTYERVRKLLTSARDMKCLPQPFEVILQKLVHLEKHSRLQLSDAMKSGDWQELEALRDASVKSYAAKTL